MVWRHDLRPGSQGNQEPTKVPYNPVTDTPAQADNPRTWSDRARAEKAANPLTTRPKAPQSKKPLSAPKRSTMDGLSGRRAVSSSASSEAAVNRLRAANAAAEKADDEKFALADSIDARVAMWKGGKADNLRALLSSLEIVLWPEAEWKKIGMAELVLPNKVKIQYMKGIAKVHPDKVSGYSP